MYWNTETQDAERLRNGKESIMCRVIHIWKGAAVVTTCAMALFSVVPRAQAGFVASRPMAMASSMDADDLQTVRAALENKAVRARLHDFGYSDAEIDQRLARMSPEQVSRLSSSIEEMQVGGDALGAAIGIVLLVLLVVLLLEVIDHEVVVT